VICRIGCFRDLQPLTQPENPPGTGGLSVRKIKAGTFQTGADGL